MPEGSREVRRGEHRITIPGSAICRKEGRHNLPGIEVDWPDGSRTKCATCGADFALVRPLANRRGVKRPAYWLEIDYPW